MTQAIHLVLYALQARVWWDWIESKANWSDGASRQFRQCPWTRKHGFTLIEVEQPWVTGAGLIGIMRDLSKIGDIGECAAGAVRAIIGALGDVGDPE